MRQAVVAAICVLATACTAGWDSLVRYSAEPARAGETPELGVYAAVLRHYAKAWDVPALVLADTAAAQLWIARMDSSEVRLPGHWADTLRYAVDAALSDTSRHGLAAARQLTTAAAIAGVTVRPVALADSFGPAIRQVPRLWIAPAGFNGDSTLAALDLTFSCGQLCAHGTTLLLARRPGRQWNIWRSFVHWIS